ncbi:11462_t:CDS:2 [Dentiscutata heterogama]|uniref:11462_t:CDS:1 n=1 Tax=Dentiscutata heterogama TaxID=1316150 RepID=A0ACA9K392_9GLOM|nr:11462_t:CDS:2 [Dentiscutata heterogama]
MEYVDSESSGFLNPNLNLNNSFDSLDRNNKLSIQMKSFSIKAKAQYINYIKGKLGLISPKPTRSIPVTYNEVQLQLAKSLLKKEEVVFMIKTLVKSLNKAK